MKFSLQNTGAPASAPEPASQELPPLARPSHRKASIGKVVGARPGRAAGPGRGGRGQRPRTEQAGPGILRRPRPGYSFPSRSRRRPCRSRSPRRGCLESSKNQDVLCQVEGSTTIISIIDEGTKVKKGDLVCELDSASLRDQLTNQKIATQGAEASYQNAKLTREVAEIAVKEYVEGIYLQDKATCQGRDQAGRVRPGPGRRPRGLGHADVREGLRLEGPEDLRGAQLPEGQVLPRAGPEQAQRARELHQGQDHQGAARARSRRRAPTSWPRSRPSQLEKTKEAKLEKQIVNCKLFAPGDGIVVYANDPVAELRQHPAADRGRGHGPRAAEDLQPARHQPRCRSTPRSTSRRSTRSPPG